MALSTPQRPSTTEFHFSQATCTLIDVEFRLKRPEFRATQSASKRQRLREEAHDISQFLSRSGEEMNLLPRLVARTSRCYSPSTDGAFCLHSTSPIHSRHREQAKESIECSDKIHATTCVVLRSFSLTFALAWSTRSWEALVCGTKGYLPPKRTIDLLGLQVSSVVSQLRHHQEHSGKKSQTSDNNADRTLLPFDSLLSSRINFSSTRTGTGTGLKNRSIDPTNCFFFAWGS